MKFSKCTLTAITLSLGMASGLAIADPAYTFTVGYHAADDAVIAKGLYKFADDVFKKSDGKIKINVSTGGALGGQREIIESVNLGALEMAIGECGLYANYISAMGMVVLPFMFESAEDFYKAMDGKVGKRFEELMYENTNMQIIAWVDGGGVRDVYSVKPLKSLADLKGLKIRTPESPAFVAMFKAFGANPTAISAPEMYTSLQQGVVDAMEGTAETAVTYGITDLAKTCLQTHHIYNESSLVINKDIFNELPDDLKKVMLDCAADMETYERNLNTQMVEDFKKTIVDAGIEMIPVDLDEAKKLVAPVYEEFIAEDPLKQEVYNLLREPR